VSADPPVRDVPLLDWPAQEEQRRLLARAGCPRLLVVADGHPPPEEWDILEDWVRAPVDVSEVMARQATLRSRLPADPAPRVDEQGLLWLGGRWVPIPPSQVAVVEQLVGHVGRLVSADVLREAYVTTGGSPDPAALKAVMGRVGRRVRLVGLQLHNVHGRGYLLEVPRVAAED
jgi:hypothetical protein